MRCRTHPSDYGVGVCACCLRERLANLTASHAGKDDVSSPEVSRNPDSSAVPPRLCRVSAITNDTGNKRVAGKLSMLYPVRSNPTPKKEESDAVVSETSGSNLCLMGINLGRKKGNKKISPHVQTVNCRGMSPVTEEEPGEGGCATKPSPGRCFSTPSPVRRQQSPRGFSSFGRCLSPLVRPSPGTHRGHATPVTPGKFRGAFNRRCSGSGSVGGGNTGVPEVSSVLVTNRSRKLVDLGKVW